MSEKFDTYLAQLSSPNVNVPDVIYSITELPGIFVFGELLDQPIIKSLKDGPHGKLLDVLHLFCYGCYKTYLSNMSNYPELRPAQVRKLKQLSIIDEAHNQKCIPYRTLFESLGLTSSRELEDLIIELFYLGAITGKIDQQREVLEVNYAIGRDMQESEMISLRTKLDSWCNQVTSVLDNMAKEIKLASDRRAEFELREKEIKESNLAVREALKGNLTKTDAHPMCTDDVSVHPDILSDNTESTRQATSNDTSSGERDTRGRMGLFRNLRYGKTK